MLKKNIIFFFTTLLLILLFFLYLALKNEDKITDIQNKEQVKVQEEVIYNSNIIEDVNYNARDAKGNQYIINADKGEIDINNSDIIFLTNVEAMIRLNNSENVKITSNFGKYNILTYDTIFSKNVIIRYLDNKINGEYVDFSIELKMSNGINNGLVRVPNSYYSGSLSSIQPRLFQITLMAQN